MLEIDRYAATVCLLDNCYGSFDKKIKELKQGMVHSDSIPVANDIMISIWDARGIVI